MADDSASKDRFDLRDSAVSGVDGESSNQHASASGKKHLPRVSRNQDLEGNWDQYREKDIEDVFNGKRASL